MSIWSAEIKELGKLYESIKGQSPELEKELVQLTKFDDPNVILLYSRRCLEVIITKLCECELKRPRGTEPLKGIIDKLHKERKVPDHIATSMHGLNDLSTYGTHPKDFDPEQVKPVLVNLDIVIKWYLKYIGRNVIVKTNKELNPTVEKEIDEPSNDLIKPKKNYVIITAGILIIAAIIFVPGLFRRDAIQRFRSASDKITVAVLPFQNMTNDTTWNVWQYVIQTNIITFLSNNHEELIVRQSELINKMLQDKGLPGYNPVTSSAINSLTEKIDADVFISGSINISDSTLRMNAQLVDVGTEDVLKSFQIDGTVDKKFSLIDSLKSLLRNFLVISKLAKEFSPDFQRLTSVTSPEAFRYFTSAQIAFNDRNWHSAGELYKKAVDLDSNFTYAYVMLSMACLNQGIYTEAKKYAVCATNRKDQMPYIQRLMADWINTYCFATPQEAVSFAKQLLEIDDQSPNYHFILGMAYLDMNQYDKAIPEYEKALELFDKWALKPSYAGTYSHLGYAYHMTGQFKKEKALYSKMERDFPDNADLLEGQAVIALTEKDTAAANRFIEKLKSVRKDLSWTEARIITNLAGIYMQAGNLDRAEYLYRQALLSEPEKPSRLNNLARFLIDTDRNLKEGLELVEIALQLTPDDYELLDTKGWGLYKLNKYNEAFDILQKSWDSRIQNAVYNHEAFQHLESAKKAAAVRMRMLP